MTVPPEPVPVPKAHVPSLVARLPAWPASSVAPSGDICGAGTGVGEGDGVPAWLLLGVGTGEITGTVGLDTAVQSEFSHSNQLPWALSAKRWPFCATTSSTPEPLAA